MTNTNTEVSYENIFGIPDSVDELFWSQENVPPEVRTLWDLDGEITAMRKNHASLSLQVYEVRGMNIEELKFELELELARTRGALRGLEFARAHLLENTSITPEATVMMRFANRRQHRQLIHEAINELQREDGQFVSPILLTERAKMRVNQRAKSYGFRFVPFPEGTTQWE